MYMIVYVYIICMYMIVYVYMGDLCVCCILYIYMDSLVFRQLQVYLLRQSEFHDFVTGPWMICWSYPSLGFQLVYGTRVLIQNPQG